MKNFTSPIQDKQNFIRVSANTKYEYQLAVNEFEDHTGKVGFVNQDPEEYSFLQISKISKQDLNKAD